MFPQQGAHGQGYTVTRATGLFIHSFIHSFTYVCSSPQKGALLHMGKKHKVTAQPHTDRRSTYNGVRPGSTRGSLTTLLFLPQCTAALSTIPFELAWVEQSPIRQGVS